MNTTEVSVAKLLQRIKEGDLDARRELFNLLGDEQQFGAGVLAIARRQLPKNHPARRFVDTRDVVQSALRTGLRHFSDFRGQTESELFGWFRAIIRSKIRRQIKPSDRGIDPTQVDYAQKEGSNQRSEPPVPDFVEEEVEQELIKILHEAVGKLPLHERLVIWLHLMGLNSSQIGKRLGLQPATIRKRESRALKKLRADKTLVAKLEALIVT